MKLSRLFVIALLAGTLGVIGCGDDATNPAGSGGSGGTGGTGGTGGSGGTGGGTDPCTGGLCDAPEPNEAKAFCIAIIAECNDTVEVDLTPEECDVLGNAAACTEGAGGAGGAGGDGGAGGGGGDLGCNVLACMTDEELKAQCEEAVQKCFIYCETEECQEDECLALGLLICNLTEG